MLLSRVARLFIARAARQGHYHNDSRHYDNDLRRVSTSPSPRLPLVLTTASLMGFDSPCVDIRTRTDPGGHADRYPQFAKLRLGGHGPELTVEIASAHRAVL